MFSFDGFNEAQCHTWNTQARNSQLGNEGLSPVSLKPVGSCQPPLHELASGSLILPQLNVQMRPQPWWTSWQSTSRWITLCCHPWSSHWLGDQALYCLPKLKRELQLKSRRTKLLRISFALLSPLFLTPWVASLDGAAVWRMHWCCLFNTSNICQFKCVIHGVCGFGWHEAVLWGLLIN